MSGPPAFTVFGVSELQKRLIKERAANSTTARIAYAELLRTKNGREPGMATLAGENAIATMLPQIKEEFLKIEKTKTAYKIPAIVPDPEPVTIQKTFIPFLVPEPEPVTTPKAKEKIFVPAIVPEEIPFLVPEPEPVTTPKAKEKIIVRDIVPEEIPFLVPGTEPVFKEKEKIIFEPFDIPETISKKIAESLEPDIVMEKTILAKKTVTGEQPDLKIPSAKPEEPPFLVGDDDVVIPETYYPGFDPEKITWLLEGNGETKRELNKAVIPVVIGLLLYFLVWS